MYQGKNKIKKAISAFAVILVELALMAATTAVFVMAFERADTKKAETAAVSSNSTQTAAVQSSSDKTNQSDDRPIKQSDDWRLVLVNYDHKLPDTFEQHIVHQFNVDIDSRIVEPYQKMHDDALKDNIKLWISSGYRSDDKQQQLYTEEIETFYKTGISYDEAVSKAAKSVAPPGTSEHITGLAIDLNGVLENFGSTKESNWLMEHAQDYGFVLRFPEDKQEITQIKYEAWHFRYVGVENAKKMKELNMCLEEYVDYLNKNQTASH